MNLTCLAIALGVMADRTTRATSSTMVASSAAPSRDERSSAGGLCRGRRAGDRPGQRAFFSEDSSWLLR